jgi:hypothetical protein
MTKIKETYTSINYAVNRLMENSVNNPLITNTIMKLVQMYSDSFFNHTHCQIYLGRK